MLPDAFSIRHVGALCPLGIVAGTNERKAGGSFGEYTWSMYVRSFRAHERAGPDRRFQHHGVVGRIPDLKVLISLPAH